MPTKTTKKTTTKPVAKKTPVKKVVKSEPVATEMPVATPCCHCTRRKKFMYLTIMFVLGIFVGQLFCFCGCDHHKRPRVDFVNGCVDVTSVKCPEMLAQLPTMDTNGDGCITKQEMRATQKHMRHHEKPVAEPTVNVEEAIAPVME